MKYDFLTLSRPRSRALEDPKKETIDNNTPTHNRQTPDGCENESEKISPNDNDMVVEDLCNDALQALT